MRSGWKSVVVSLIVSATGCRASESVTLCSAAKEPVDFVVRFTQAEPKEVSGTLAPGVRTTVNVSSRGDGDYSVELRHGADVRRFPRGYYTRDGGVADTFTVRDDLSLTDGCSTAPRG